MNQAPASVGQAGAAAVSPPPTHTVRAGESLWSVAETTLGSGHRYTELAALNTDVLGDRPGFLIPGTLLQLPASQTIAPTATTDTLDSSNTGGDATAYLVQPGDTLSAIAQEHLGDAQRYPDVFDASIDVTQPGGARLTDPDVIDVGWTLTLPTDAPTFAASDPVPDQAQLEATSESASSTTPVPGPAGTDTPETTPGEVPSPEPTPNVLDRTPATPAEVSDSVDEAPRADEGSTPAGPVDRFGERPAGDGDTTVNSEVSDPSEQDQTVQPGWVLLGLTGAGAILAGSVWVALHRRRRTQARSRRPGRVLPAPEPALNAVEKTVDVVGSGSAPTVDFMDDALRRLAGSRSAAGLPMPNLAAVELTDHTLVVHLRTPTHLPAPWQGSPDELAWALPHDEDLAASLSAIGPLPVDQPAPYPLVVTIGASDTGDVWLLNCEEQVLTITGDPTYGRDLARYIAAEIACNPWSQDVRLTCVGVADEVQAMSPERIHVYPVSPAAQRPQQYGEPDEYGAPDNDHPRSVVMDPAAVVLADAVATLDRLNDPTAPTGMTTATARADQSGADAWGARMLLVDVSGATEPTTDEAAADSLPPETPGGSGRAAVRPSPALGELLRLLDTHAGQTATSVILHGHRDDTPGMVLDVTDAGRVMLRDSGLNLVAVGLTHDEALGCAALLAQAEDTTDVAMPEDDPATAEGWRVWANEAGALREDFTLPRAIPVDEIDEPVTSLLNGPDSDYIRDAATTVDDLAALAPHVAATLREEVEDADPTLDADLTAWFADDCPHPRLRILGPVGARTRGVPVTKRTPFYTEVLTYLATRPHGATPAELADALAISPTAARNAVHMVREWLGVNPTTSARYLPDARDAPAATDRGVAVYQVVDVLVDADLFRRLRVRGEARGEAGIDDLIRALTLVTGQPFDKLRPGGWSWLHDGDRLDQHLLCAIVDVAHIITTHSLRAGDLTRARDAAELAALAAPYEEIPRLDLAAVAAADGHHHEARRIALDDICNRTDDTGPPPELSPRTERILNDHDWLTTTSKAAS